MSKAILQLHQVNAFYGAIQALNQVSLEITEGEIVTLIGANGAGKTTLLMSIFGDPRARNGNIYYRGQDITALETHRIPRLGIALVPEGRRVFPAMTVEENLHMGAIVRQNEHMELDEVFALFPRLAERRHQRAGTLSGGEQQMLAIGRALMSKPQLLLLDEPSLGLAPLIVQQIFTNLRQIADSGMTIFLVEQNAHHALRLANRGYVMVNGTIKLTGSGKELLQNPQVSAAYLGGH